MPRYDPRRILVSSSLYSPKESQCDSTLYDPRTTPHSSLSPGGSLVLLAINRLKHTELRIDAAQRQYRVLKRKQSKERILQQISQRKALQRETVQEAALSKREMLRNAEEYRRSEVEQRKARNERLAQQNKIMLERVRQEYSSYNRSMYQKRKSKKTQNQSMIKAFRVEIRDIKHRKKQEEEKKEYQRKNNIEKYKKEKIYGIKRGKKQDAMMFLEQVEKKAKYLQTLQSRNSRVRPQRSSSSLSNPQDT